MSLFSVSKDFSKKFTHADFPVEIKNGFNTLEDVFLVGKKNLKNKIMTEKEIIPDQKKQEANKF